MKHIKYFDEVINERETYPQNKVGKISTHIVSIGNTIMDNLTDIQKKILDKEQQKKINFVKELVWKFKEGERHMTEDELDELYDRLVLSSR